MYFSTAALMAMAAISGADSPEKADLSTGRNLQSAPVFASHPNVARGKPASMICQLGGLTAQAGVDGVKDAGKFFHTCNNKDQWWKVDLNGTYEIHGIWLHNSFVHSSCLECSGRLSNSKVQVLLNGEIVAEHILGNTQDVGDIAVDFQEGVIGDEVKIFNPTNLIHLREVEVYGTPPPPPTTNSPTQTPTASPTQAPTSSPTQAPTSSPTQAPTSSPTQAPTSNPTTPELTTSPTPAPWDIKFKNVTFDMTVDDEDNELVLEYSIGKGRIYSNNLYAKGCQDREAINVAYANSNSTMDSDPGMSKLIVNYNFNKSTIATSNMWNSTSEQLELCHIVQLLLPRNGEESMVITSDMRDLTLGVNTLASFSTAVNLTGQIINENNVTTALDSYVVAIRCSSSGDPVPSGTTLGPNDPLYVCISSRSPDEVEVKTVNTMVISQDGEEKFVVLRNGGDPVVPTISSLEYNLGGSDTHQVNTRIPSNVVSFAAGKSIGIAGTLTMKLAGSSGRALREVGARGLQGADGGAGSVVGEEETSFAFAVDLEDGAAGDAGGAGILTSSARAAAKNIGFVLWALSAAAYVIMM